MKKLIIVISVALIVILGSIIGLEVFGEVTDVHKLVPNTSTAKQDSNDYFVYYTSPTCSFCIKVAPDVVSFYKTLEEKSDVPMYLVDMSQESNKTSFIDGDDVENVDYYLLPSKIPEDYDVANFKITGTPTLIRVTNGKVVEIAVGASTQPTTDKPGGTAELLEKFAKEKGFEYDAMINN
ncbi:MAG: thioredoxin fold domain-containing protein [Mycoplasmatales bacterium]